MPLAAVGDHPFCSDIVAWSETVGEPLCANDVNLPVGDIRWGQCFTRGAFQTCTREVGGAGMFSKLLVGDQLWIVARCLDEMHPPFSKTGLFATVRDIFTFDQELDEPPSWMFEAIYLKAGTLVCVFSSSSTSCAFSTFVLVFCGRTHRISFLPLRMPSARGVTSMRRPPCKIPFMVSSTTSSLILWATSPCSEHPAGS